MQLSSMKVRFKKKKLATANTRLEGKALNELQWQLDIGKFYTD